MKDLTFPFDPIVASDVKVFPGFVANTILQDSLFTPNVTIVTSMLKWTIRMFCDFEFSKYPFDLQTCKLRFITGQLNITNHAEDINNLFFNTKVVGRGLIHHGTMTPWSHSASDAYNGDSPIVKYYGHTFGHMP